MFDQSTNRLHSTQINTNLLSQDYGHQTLNPIQTQPQATHHQVTNPPVFVQQPLTTQRVWSTTLFECFRDEESCWWGFWCCCVLAARNTKSFELGSAKKQISYVLSAIAIFYLLLIIGFPGFALLFLVSALTYYAYYRAQQRGEIRHKLGNIFGTFISDFIHHCCCLCCTITQEAREAKIVNTKLYDYCTDQELSELNPTSLSTEENDHMHTFPDRYTIQEAYTQLSDASKFILYFIACFVGFLIINLLIVNPLALFVLLIIFIQPIFILYVVYWQSRRKYAQLDYVIKLFIVGFFMATTQSIVFEYLLQSMIGFCAIIVFAIFNPNYVNNNNSTNSSDSSSASAAFASFSFSSTNLWTTWEGKNTLANSFLSQIHHIIANQHVWWADWIENMTSSSSIISTSSYTSSALTSSYGYIHPQNMTLGINYPSVYPYLDTSMSTSSNSTDISTLSPHILRENFFLVLIVLLLMAFVVAAGVEETMKHFVVRCCRFPYVLKDPHIILVYLMSGALGFATSENIEYVFGTKTSPIHGTSLFVGELFVLAIRILMPVHVICSVLQAANLSKVSSFLYLFIVSVFIYLFF